MPRTEPPASSYDRITSEHHASLKGDTTDLSCGHTRGALWQHKMSVVARQDLCGGKRQGRRPSAAPLCGSLVSCHNRGLVLSQQTSCLATAHIFSCRTRYPSRQERLREWTNQIQGSLPRPDFSGTNFIFFEIGDWEIVIVKKNVSPRPPAWKSSAVDPHPIISRRRPNA